MQATRTPGRAMTGRAGVFRDSLLVAERSQIPRMPWPQNYAPLDSALLSTLVAAVPVVVLLGLLGLAHWRAHWAALAGLASALAVAVFAFKMPPALALASAGFGAAFGLFPIGWIVLNALFIYELSVQTGQFAADMQVHLVNDGPVTIALQVL